MSERIQLLEDVLGDVTGGEITYTWDGTVGTIGMNGRNPYILNDKDAFIKYFNSVRDTKTNAEILRYLLENGIASVK